MGEQIKYTGQLVFGLDIGTRSIVGTAGYKEKDQFHVVAQYIKEHETRAMLDGQIHDIPKVAETIEYVKERLEEQINRPLKEVCIAAAGRVLKTVTTTAECQFAEDTLIEQEHIYSLDLLGVEKAHEELVKENDSDMKFYCVGYTVVKYFLNNYPMGNLENHKAKHISAEIIVTFLPEDVVDGLYKAVELAGLQVANLTLEPIAAINVAIPEMYRMLNIALVDVGAGTSDICITKDGSIVAYGMIPFAGDEITETLARNYLMDFKSADNLKIDATANADSVSYKDIMGIVHDIKPEEVHKITEPVVEQITKAVAEKIIELNGGKPVSAVFVVGGGGKITGFTGHLAQELELSEERVALRGEEVMAGIHFWQDIKKDPLLVTPIGICLNFYDQKNNFIFANFNGERVKLYDNNKLSVVDAAMQAGFPNDALFPKRGKELVFYVDKKQRIVRGELGEAAVVIVNGQPASINAPIAAGDVIEIKPSTAGAPAECLIEELPEHSNTISFYVDGRKIECQKFAQVNGQLVSGYYSIQNGDSIRMLKYYTVKQLFEFMDIVLEYGTEVYVNNRLASKEEKVYENFTVTWNERPIKTAETSVEEEFEAVSGQEAETDKQERPKQPPEPPREPIQIQVLVNGKMIELKGKSEYTFVDAFDAYGFDMSEAKGSELVTKINEETASFISRLNQDDMLEIYWKE